MKRRFKISLATLAIVSALATLVIPVSARVAHRSAAHPSARSILTRSDRQMLRLKVYHFHVFTEDRRVYPSSALMTMVNRTYGEVILVNPQRVRLFGVTKCRGDCAYGAGTSFGGRVWVGRRYAQLLKGKWYCSTQPPPRDNPLAPTSEVKSISGTRVVGRSRVKAVLAWQLLSPWGSRAGSDKGFSKLWISIVTTGFCAWWTETGSLSQMVALAPQDLVSMTSMASARSASQFGFPMLAWRESKGPMDDRESSGIIWHFSAHADS
jgi:hypothetical protein